jgi:hypothetical protein
VEASMAAVAEASTVVEADSTAVVVTGNSDGTRPAHSGSCS